MIPIQLLRNLIIHTKNCHYVKQNNHFICSLSIKWYCTIQLYLHLRDSAHHKLPHFQLHVYLASLIFWKKNKGYKAKLLINHNIHSFKPNLYAMGLENPQYLYIMYSKWLESPFPKAQDFLSLLVFNGVSIMDLKIFHSRSNHYHIPKIPSIDYLAVTIQRSQL